MKHKHLFLFFAIALFASTCQKISAQVFYDFIEVDTADEVARLEISAIPATHAEMLSLTFTPVGDAIFGFGSIYLGTFDGTSDPSVAISENGLGELVCTGCGGGANFFSDQDPPSSTNPEFGDSREFFLFFTQNESLLAVTGTFPSFFLTGTWLAVVPEPSSYVLVVCGVLLIDARLRRIRTESCATPSV